RIVWEFTVDPIEGRGHVVGQFLETGAIQDSERSFYTAPEIRTLLELAGLEARVVSGDLALTVPAQDAEPSFFFRARSRQRPRVNQGDRLIAEAIDPARTSRLLTSTRRRPGRGRESGGARFGEARRPMRARGQAGPARPGPRRHDRGRSGTRGGRP